jgi:hypothetical protein
MKIQVTFKSPDAVDFAIEDQNLEEHRDEIEKKLKKFVRWGEYIDVEFDLDKMTAKVLLADEDDE